jgi:hypothetical protein
MAAKAWARSHAVRIDFLVSAMNLKSDPGQKSVIVSDGIAQGRIKKSFFSEKKASAAGKAKRRLSI